MYLQFATEFGISKSLAILMGIFVKFSIGGVRKTLMHLLNFVLQRHNDAILVTYKREAKTDKKAVI